MKINCDECGKEIQRTPYKIKQHKHQFCSVECRISFSIGKKHTKEHCNNISKGNMGRIFTQETRDKISKARLGIEPWNKGKKMSKEFCENNSIGHKNQKPTEIQKKQVSETLKQLYKDKTKHPRWKNGVTPLTLIIRHLEESSNWRDLVFKRDKYTCQNCGAIGNIEAHHIKEFNIILSEFLKVYSQFSPIEDKETLVRLAITYEPFWDINNGETLCQKCHDKLKINREVIL